LWQTEDCFDRVAANAGLRAHEVAAAKATSADARQLRAGEHVEQTDSSEGRS